MDLNSFGASWLGSVTWSQTIPCLHKYVQKIQEGVGPRGWKIEIIQPHSWRHYSQHMPYFQLVSVVIFIYKKQFITKY